MDDAVTGGDAQAPPVRHLTPAGLPKMVDPGDLRDRCHVVCRRYVECFGPAVDFGSCESLCVSEVWVEDAGDLACFMSSGCTELYLCAE